MYEVLVIPRRVIVTGYPPLSLIEEARISIRTDPLLQGAIAGAPPSTVLTGAVKTLNYGPRRITSRWEEAGEMVGERGRESGGEMAGQEWVEGGSMSGTGGRKAGGREEGGTETGGGEDEKAD